MEKAVESRAMLTVTHAMSFVTSCGANCVRKSQWFKHPDSVDEYWWQVTSDVENQVATISIMVEKFGNLLSDSVPEVLDDPFIVCANECKVYQKIQGPGRQTLSKFLLPGSNCCFGVHQVAITRKRHKVLKVRFGGTPTQLTVVVSFTLLNDKKIQQQMMLYLRQPLSFAIGFHNVSLANKSLWETMEFADVTVEVKDKKSISAHKVVLMAGSPVFKAMFEHDTVEKRDNKITMPDVSLVAVTEALRFMYTGSAKTDDLDLEMIQELLELSERYDLLPLKSMCESSLINSLLYREDGWITSENAIDLLPLANLYRMSSLKEACQVALAWHIRDHTVEYFKLALDSKSDLLRKFAFERLVALRHPHFQEEGWKELQQDYPEEVEALLIAQINAHGSSPGITRFDKD